VSAAPALDAAPSMLDAAITLARRVGPVVVLHEPHPVKGCTCPEGKRCGSPGKHPRLKGWEAAATRDETQIRKWWGAGMWPTANVGVACGVDGLIVLDIDGAEGAASLDQLEADHGPLPDTLRARSGRVGGGGEHRYFRATAEQSAAAKLGNTSGKLGVKLDTRGAGGQVVAPPSLHASGARYAWVDSEATIAQLPAWLFELLTKEREDAPPAEPTPEPEEIEARRRLATHAGRPHALARFRAYVAKHPGADERQGGGKETFRLAAVGVKGFMLDGAIVLGELRGAWNARCSPPWTAAALAHKVSEAPRYTGIQWGQHLEESRPMPERPPLATVRPFVRPAPRPAPVVLPEPGAQTGPELSEDEQDAAHDAAMRRDWGPRDPEDGAPFEPPASGPRMPEDAPALPGEADAAPTDASPAPSPAGCGEPTPDAPAPGLDVAGVCERLRSAPRPGRYAVAHDPEVIALAARLDPEGAPFGELANAVKLALVPLKAWRAAVAMLRPAPATPPPPTDTETRDAFVRGDHTEIAARLIAQLETVGGELRDMAHDDGALYRYEGDALGVWAKLDEPTQSRVVQGLAGASVMGSSRPLSVNSSDVKGSIALARDQKARPGFFGDAPAGLTFSNGFVVVSAEGVRILPHSADNRARHTFDFAYDQSDSGSCPQWLAFLQTLFGDAPDYLDRVSLIQEFFGVSLIGEAWRFQQALVMWATGDNGKSTLMNAMVGCFPAGTCAAIPPQLWGDGDAISGLVGKRLNAVSELPESDILASEAFKGIIDGSTARARPLYVGGYEFKPRAGHVFSANRLPGTTDQTPGFWRRWIVLRMSRTIPAGERLLSFEETLINERPAIVAWLIEGAQRALQAKRYTLPTSHHAALAEWRQSADNVAQFCETCVIEAPEDEKGTRAMMLYRAYSQWAKDNGNKALSQRHFADRMRLLGKPSKKDNSGQVYPVVFTTDGAAIDARAARKENHERW
jgi:P4 family phage/plasmid primase-like protien